MDNLRWIILTLGLLVVLFIYFIGRNKSKPRKTSLSEVILANDMPSLSTKEKALVEEKVKINDEFVASEINHFELNQDLVEKVTASVDEVLTDVMTSGAMLKSRKSVV